jgi:anti-anti-sigma regulatory factor
MVLKIDRSVDGKHVVLRLSGRMQSEHVEQLKAEMQEVEGVVLDLEDVKLVDREAVRFLSECEANGVELKNCSPYIREWIAKERTLGSRSEQA